MPENESYFEKLKSKADNFVHLVYSVTRKFPKEEIYGITSQLRRSSMSVALNIVEGFARARDRKNVHKNFLEIAYGSLQESDFLIEFSLKERYMTREDFDKLKPLSKEIGAMIWGIIRKLKT